MSAPRLRPNEMLVIKILSVLCIMLSLVKFIDYYICRQMGERQKRTETKKKIKLFFLNDKNRRARIRTSTTKRKERWKVGGGG